MNGRSGDKTLTKLLGVEGVQMGEQGISVSGEETGEASDVGGVGGGV